MEPDGQMRNLRDFLLVYNKMTEICFNKCISNLNYRSVTVQEEHCVSSCAGKLIRTNHRLMGTYVQLMPTIVQKRISEYESKMPQGALPEPGLNPGLPAPDVSPGVPTPEVTPGVPAPDVPPNTSEGKPTLPAVEVPLTSRHGDSTTSVDSLTQQR
uniref:Mitochondrial import inner membrane translocase subunit Tim9 B n=1 Tax=Callorhinchus milii TaxID=7868 RepID=V9KTN7_CALMI